MFVTSSESKQTQDFYQSALLEFCISKWETDPDTRKYGRAALSDEMKKAYLDKLGEYIREPSRSDVLEDMRNFRTYLNGRKIRGRNREGKPIAAKTKKGFVAGMQAFLSMNEIRFQSKIHRNTFQIKEEEDTDDLPYTLEKAQKVYPLLSPAMKGFFLFILCTGTRIRGALKTDLSDVKWNTSPVQVWMAPANSKTKKGSIAFLTKECSDYLRDYWLKKFTDEDGRTTTNREIYLRGALTRGNGLPHLKNFQRQKAEENTRLFPMAQSTVQSAFKKAVEKAGFGEINNKGYAKIHPHSTRKMFRNVVGRYGSPDAAHTIMQHRPGRDAEYLTLSVEECRTDFMKSEPYLTLGISDEAREALTTKNTHAVAILDLQSQVAELKTKASVLEDLLNVHD
jgi:hypothetical protein